MSGGWVRSMIVNRIHQNQCHLRPMNVSVFWQLWWMCDKRWHFHLRYLSTEWMRSKPCRRWTHSLTIHIQISYTVRRFIERTKHQFNRWLLQEIIFSISHLLTEWMRSNPHAVNDCIKIRYLSPSGRPASNALHRQHPCYAFISTPFLSLAFQTLYTIS